MKHVSQMIWVSVPIKVIFILIHSKDISWVSVAAISILLIVICRSYLKVTKHLDILTHKFFCNDLIVPAVIVTQNFVSKYFCLFQGNPKTVARVAGRQGGLWHQLGEVLHGCWQHLLLRPDEGGNRERDGLQRKEESTLEDEDGRGCSWLLGGLHL